MANNNTIAPKEQPADKAKRLLGLVTKELASEIEKAEKDPQHFGKINVGFTINGGTVDHGQVTVERRYK